MIVSEEQHRLMHYGTPRKSGRYPWGSGDNAPEATRSKDILDDIEFLKNKGMSEAEIAKGMGYASTTELRNKKSRAKAEVKQASIIEIERLKEKGMSNTAIARQTGIAEPTVRLYQKAGEKDKADVYHSTANMLREQIKAKDVVDVGRGVPERLGITPDRLKVSLSMLKDEGYGIFDLPIRQLGTGNITIQKVLAKPGITRKQIDQNRLIVKQIQDTYSEDRGRSFLNTQPPLSISSRRVAVVYGKEGAKADGMIYVKPGVDRLKIGDNRYGQVRIMVDGTHYLKGMAAYKDNLPDHIDVEFHTKKDDTGRKKDAMKELEKDPVTGKVDPDNPFGTIVRQVHNPKTGKVSSAMNLVGGKEGAGEEGYWDTWSRSLSSQMLSKQDPALAKQQLDLTFERRKKEYDEILSLTNATVRQQLLYKFGDEADAASAHLKAANLPRQSNKVLLPVRTMNPKEIYAPSYKNGERVVLIRFPHGGTFEIPELTVNNKNKEAQRIIGRQAIDAVGIHHSVAHHLSGADFDGDTVLVIPNPKRDVKKTSPLEGLKDFDPMIYKIKDPSIKPPTAQQKGTEMGKISNLITDMTLQGASREQLTRAIKHSMVVIDSEKHGLDFRQSEKDNNILALKAEYQGGERRGASTIISRKKSEVRVPKKQLWSPGPRSIDPKTGEKIFKTTTRQIAETKTRTIQGKKVKVETGRMITPLVKSTKGAEARDARTLVSGDNIYMETLYATHSNKLKALANAARKEAVLTKPPAQNKSAKKVYKSEVDSLKAKLDKAKGNAPLERQAQQLAGVRIRQQRQANPGMDKETEKKMKFKALDVYRERVGAKKDQIVITPREWEAIQAGAISNHMLTEILSNADVDRVKYLALPKTEPKMTSNMLVRARAMANSGFTQAEIAEQLGVGLTTLKVGLSE